ncbi:hypothetical protein [Actinoplanes sp. NPDC051494]|uniref:hypothetical protein n=1 Tax=Actinoplanes sp. NPDC051494 TaxID=3363907 RepID=UPI00379F299A
MSSLRDDLAAYIRKVDEGYELSPYQLAELVAVFLHEERDLVSGGLADQIQDFAYEQNRGAGYRHPKPLTSDALAADVVDRFGLDKDQP